MSKIISLFLIVSVVFVMGYFVINKYINRSTKNTVSTPNVTQVPTAQQTKSDVQDQVDPLVEITNKYGDFATLTIPYLQSQTFLGSPINIKQTLNTSGNFSSYIASYQSEGLEINGLLTKPNTQQPNNGFPAIVFLHGYIPPSQYVTTQKYEAYVNYLANRGFVVYKIDYRGHGQSEGEPGGSYFSSDYIIDTINAVESLKTLDYVDSNRVGLWGHSMSGNVALRSLAAKPDLINGAVIWAGAGFTYKDFFDYRISDSSYVRPSPNPSATPSVSRRVRDQLGDFDSNMEYWNLVAPVNYLDSTSPPVQLHHSSNDNVVTVEYSRNLSSILEQNGAPYEYYEYTSGGHNLTSPAFEQAMQRTVEFFNSN